MQSLQELSSATIRKNWHIYKDHIVINNYFYDIIWNDFYKKFDVDEMKYVIMFRDFIELFNIPLQRVCCMPGMDDQDQFHERTQWVLEMAKKYKFVGLTRLHISAWDKTLNV